jgi:lysophospholipase L1-like esterase
MRYERRLIRDFVQAQKDHPDWPVVISEGDSWFSHSNVIGHLDTRIGPGGKEAQQPWALLRLEKGGDEILTILSGGQRSLLRKTLNRWAVDVILFSAGGNDIIGPDLLPLLRDYTDGAQAADLIVRSRFERRLRQVADCYRELMDLVADTGHDTLVFVNSYDYAVPSNRPVKLLGLVRITGPWMIEHFEERKIPKPLQPDIIRLLIDDFCDTLDEVAAEPRAAGRLIRVETRGAVQGSWKDEIHPARPGARRVAKELEKALRNQGVIR